MSQSIPPGTRDVLPEEMRELREISSRMRETFEGAGYGEVHTPALEYEEVLRRGGEHAAGGRYRTFDEQGGGVGPRYGDAEPPLRFCYFAHAWRAVERGVGEPREFLQGGLELIGTEGPEGDAEVVALTIAALDAAGLRRHRIGIGDGSLYRTLLRDLRVPEDRHMPLLECLSRRDLVGLERVVSDLPARELLVELPTLRGGPEVLDRAEGLGALHAALERRGVADRVIYDLGLVRELGYYTGAVFEVYDPAVGFALGGGGRYDELLGRFGRALPACGIALDLQRVHLAQAAEEALA